MKMHELLSEGEKLDELNLAGIGSAIGRGLGAAGRGVAGAARAAGPIVGKAAGMAGRGIAKGAQAVGQYAPGVIKGVGDIAGAATGAVVMLLHKQPAELHKLSVQYQADLCTVTTLQDTAESLVQADLWQVMKQVIGHLVRLMLQAVLQVRLVAPEQMLDQKLSRNLQMLIQSLRVTIH